MSVIRPTRQYAELVRFACLESLIAHRRILCVGGVSAERAASLVQLRARFVCAIDADPARIEEVRGAGHPQNLSLQCMPYGALTFRDGSFDLVILPEIGRIDDRAALVAEARRVLDPRGYLAAFTRNRDCSSSLSRDEDGDGTAVSYGDLYGALVEHFAVVTMFGQSPFVGYGVVDFTPADEEPAISFDASLLHDEGEEAEFFWAIAGPDRPALDRFAILQVPSSFVTARRAATPTGRLAEQIREAEQAVEREQKQRAALQAQLEALGARAEELEQSAGRLRDEAAEHRSAADDRGVKIQQLELEREKIEEDGRKARERAAQAAKDCDDEKKARQKAELELGIARKNPEMQEARSRLAELEQALDGARTQAGGELERLRAEVEQIQAGAQRELERVRSEAGTEIGRLRGELEQATAERERAAQSDEALRVASERAAAAEAEAQRLEQELHERAQRLAELRAGVEQREVLLRDALEQVKEATARGPEPAEIEALRAQLAERQAEIGSARAEALELRGHLGGLDAAGADLRARLEAAGARLAEREADLQRAEWKASEIETEREHDRAERDALQRSLVAIEGQQNEAAAARKETEKLQETVSSMQIMLAAFEGERRGFLVRLAELDVEHARKSAEPTRSQELRAVGEVKDSYEKRIAEIVAETERARAEASQREARTAVIEEALSERDQQIGELSGKIDELETQARNAPAHGASRDLDGLRVESIKQREQIERLQKQLDEREMLFKSLSAQIEERDSRIHALEKKVRDDRERTGAGEVAGWKKEMQARDGRITRLQDELDREGLARRSLELQLGEIKSRSGDDLSKQVRRLNELLGDRDAEVLLAQARIEASERDLRRLRADLAKARDGIERLAALPRTEGIRDELGSLLALLSR